jgi:RNA polymerase sigma-70 factor (ECF subfamily)
MNLYTWLHKIAYNTCIDFLRSKKSKSRLDNIVRENDNGTDYNYIPEHIRGALMKLKEIDRALVYGHVMAEKTFGELAEIHNKKPAALRKRYERAKKKLIGILAEYYPNYNINNNSLKDWRNEDETEAEPCQ